MKSKILKLTKKPFVRNVIILSSGTAAAQMIGLLLTPFITRLYGPEAYGLMGTFIAIITLFSPIAALTYPIAIVLPKSDREAKGLIHLSLYISVTISVVIGIFLILFHQSIVRIFRLEDVARYLFLIPLVILLAGFLQVLEQWLLRTKQFTVSAKATFLQALIVNGGKVGFGFFHPVASVLIIFTALTHGIKALLMLVFTEKSKYKQMAELSSEKNSTIALAKRHRDFPLFRTPEVFISALSGSLPVLLLTSLFGPASAGFYSIGRTVLGVPSQLLGKSVGDVFYPRIAEAAKNGENLTRLIKKATLSLGLVGILPYGVVVIFGPWLFSFVFGEDWIVAGEYARWIALWAFFGFLNKPSVKALPVLAAQAFQLGYTIIMLLIRVTALFIGFYYFSSDKVAVALFGISGALLNMGLILITLYISNKYDKT